MKTKLTICKEILKERIQFMESPASLKKYCDEKRFIRKRKLSMKQLIYFLFYSSKASMNLNLAKLYDVLEDIIVDGILQKYTASERPAAVKHLASLESLTINKNSVVLFDRGYPSYEFYRYFNEKGYYFLMRMQGNVTSLTQLGKEDAVTEYLPSKKKRGSC